MSRNAVVRGQLTEIGARLDGVLVSIEAREGEQLKAGQVLARMDDSHLRFEVSEAQALIDGLQREIELEHSTIKHERLKRDTLIVESMAKSATAHAEVVAARSRADEARDYRNVRQALLESKMISPEAVREAESKYRTAQAMVDAAWGNEAAKRSAELSARIESDGIKLREQRIGVLVANVEAAKARLARAQADMESVVIRAPADGAVIRWLVNSGGSVETGRPVVSMSIGRDVRIEAWIDEDEIGLIKVGSATKVTLPSHPGRVFSGVVETIGIITDFELAPADVPQPRSTRMRGAPMVGVVVRLQDAPETLMPGMTAVAAIRGEGR
ncbi:MAG: efflux RND transporter periplasmic adaptor subunit [Thiobacillus sp.]